MDRTTLTVVGGALLLALAGCSSDQGEGIASAGGASSAAREQVSDEEQARVFAECMRAHGIDLPDPQPDGNGGFDWGAGAAGVEFDDPAFREALGACRDELPGGGREFLDDPQTQAQLREFARCMRDNGFPDFPDPDPDSGFGGAFGEVDRGSPQFKQAMDACGDELPGGGER